LHTETVAEEAAAAVVTAFDDIELYLCCSSHVEARATNRPSSSLMAPQLLLLLRLAKRSQ